jgi:hypothetical protein
MVLDKIDMRDQTYSRNMRTPNLPQDTQEGSVNNAIGPAARAMLSGSLSQFWNYMSPPLK